MFLLDEQEFNERLAARIAMEPHFAAAVTWGLFDKHGNYSEAELERAVEFARMIGRKSWIQGVAQDLVEHRRLRRREDRVATFQAGGHILEAIDVHIPLENHHFLGPDPAVSLDAAFGLCITRGEGAGERLADIPFNIHLVEGKPHLVIYAVQGKDKQVAQKILKAFPQTGEFEGKDWRTRVVLAVEKTCKGLGIPFAALNPKLNRELRHPFSPTDNARAHQIRSLAISHHNRTYREAGLELVKGGRFYKRL